MAKLTKARRDKLVSLAEPIAEADGSHYIVVVTDERRGSVTTYAVDGAGDPSEIAQGAVISHDTVTDAPEGVTALVYPAEAQEAAQTLDHGKAVATHRA